MQSANLLQRLVLPAPTTPEPLLYVRTSGDVRMVDNGAVLEAGGTLSFDTTFGVFAAGRWRRVSHVNDLSVSVRASGMGVAEIVVVNGKTESVVSTVQLPRGEGSPSSVTLEVPNLQTSTDGTYYVRVSAIGGEVCMTGGEWVTQEIGRAHV